MVTVLKILSDLKEKKISASTVEKDLGFSNGLLGKAAKETTKLSPEKMAKLVAYYNLKILISDPNTFTTAPQECVQTSVEPFSVDGYYSAPGNIGADLNMEILNKPRNNIFKAPFYEQPIAGEAVTVHLSKNDHYPPSETSIKVRPLLPWMKAIEDYCQEKGIIPEDLIASHKNQDRFKVGEKVGGDGIITKVVTDEKGQTDHVKPERVHVAQLSNFMKELQKKKNGQP